MECSAPLPIDPVVLVFMRITIRVMYSLFISAFNLRKKIIFTRWRINVEKMNVNVVHMEHIGFLT